MNNKDIIPYARQQVTTEDIDEVVRVLKSSHLTQGKEVPLFEQEVSNLVNAKYSVALQIVRQVLCILCMALDLGPGDYLWTSSISFVASANCGIYCGAKIEFIDIEEDTGLVCIEALEKKLRLAKKDGRLPKIVIPVHLAGSSCDMANIGRLAKEYNFKVIEDASHAIGGEYRCEKIGNCSHSDITVFSFHPVKIITAGEGGLATTNIERYALAMQSKRSHGITKDQSKFVLLDNKPWSYEQQDLGYNYRMNDIEASLGKSQLKRIDQILNCRRKQFKTYKESLIQIDSQ